MSIRTYGEFELIRRIRQRLHPPGRNVILGIGDDAAAIRPAPGALILYSTDTLVENIDFMRDFSSWEQVGWKAMAAGMSDIAAKGGDPKYALVTLCLPDDLAVEDVDAIFDGMERLARRHDLMIIGGDLSGTAGPTTLAVTLIGEIPPERLIRRSGARVGDALCVTGHLGASDAGLRLLRRTRRSGRTRYPDVVKKHRTPAPRIREGRILAESKCVHAMIDVSDGLSADVLHVAQESGTGISLDTRKLPVDDETRKAAAALHVDPIRLALHSGEEFELLCAVDPRKATALRRKVEEETGTPLTVIGAVTPLPEGHVWIDDGGRHPLSPGGYDHFGRRE